MIPRDKRRFISLLGTNHCRTSWTERGTLFGSIFAGKHHTQHYQPRGDDEFGKIFLGDQSLFMASLIQMGRDTWDSSSRQQNLGRHWFGMHTQGVIRKVEQGIEDGHLVAFCFRVCSRWDTLGLTAKTLLLNMDNSRGMIGCRSCKHMAEEQHDLCLDNYSRRDLYGYHGSAWTRSWTI